jgi:hypothetical protein
MTPLPLGFSPLRAEAERLASEMCRTLGRRATVQWWGEPCVCEEHDLRDVLTVLHAHHLADLTRPESRDFWARWLAGRLGLTCGPTAPRWRRLPGGGWRLRVSPEWIDLRDPGAQDDPGEIVAEAHYACVGGIDGITDPVEALLAAVLALGVDRA